MPKYSVIRHAVYLETVEVVAEDERRAKEKASIIDADVVEVTFYRVAREEMIDWSVEEIP